jgi:hypothetical protein
MCIHEFVVKGFTLAVDFDYSPPSCGGIYEPPEPAKVTINSVKLNDVEISDIVSQAVFDEIDLQILEGVGRD